MSKTVLVTGGTGSVGIPLVQSLLQRGDEVVVMARRPIDRINGLFPGHDGRLTVIEGDVSFVDGALTSEVLSALRGKVDVLVHAAAIVQYHETMRDKMMETNFQGTLNMLDLSARLEIPRFIYVSTAYVAGLRQRFSEDDWGRSEDAQNPYEVTKQLAEQAVANWRRADTSILRLGTVIGDGGTGYTTGFGGFYGFVQSVWIHRDRLRRYPLNPFHVAVNPASTLNLVPLSWVNDAIVKVLDASGLPEVVFHLTHPKPVNMGWLFKETFHEVLKLPVEFDRARVRPAGTQEWDKLQRVIERSVKYFGHYVTEEAEFGFQNLQVFFPDYPPPPDVDADMVRTILKFAEERSFGRAA